MGTPVKWRSIHILSTTIVAYILGSFWEHPRKKQKKKTGDEKRLTQFEAIQRDGE